MGGLGTAGQGLGPGLGNALGPRATSVQPVGLWVGPEGDRDAQVGWGGVRKGPLA